MIDSGHCVVLCCLCVLAAAPLRAQQTLIMRHNPLGMRFRQLMLNDRVVTDTDHVEKVYPQLTKDRHVCLRPTEPWETAQNCMFLYGSVLYDEADERYKMWYQVIYGTETPGKPSPYTYATCYAESSDGLTWERPRLGNVDFFGDRGANNIVITGAAQPHVFLDDSRPPYRYRFYFPQPDRVGFSRDGKKVERLRPIDIPKTPGLTEMAEYYGSAAADSMDVMHDTVRGNWRGMFKTWAPLAGSVVPTVFRRSHAIAVSDDGVTGWRFAGRMLAADLADDAYVQHRPHEPGDTPAWAEVYDVPQFVYEGIYIGLPCLFYQFGDLFPSSGGDAEIFLAWSNDGLNWQRPRRRTPLIPNGPEGGPDDGFLVCQVNAPVRHGNELWVYYTANPHRHAYPLSKLDDADQLMTIRVGTLRVDGWAGYRAGDTEGVVQTEHFIADGSLRVNADCRGGALAVEVLRAHLGPYGRRMTTQPVPGFGRGDCRTITGDQYNDEVQWKTGKWSDLRGQPVVLRIYLTNATLYSFWTKP